MRTGNMLALSLLPASISLSRMPLPFGLSLWSDLTILGSHHGAVEFRVAAGGQSG